MTETRYKIEIEKPDREEEYCTLIFSKEYGDMHGGCRGCDSREQVIQMMKDEVKIWESFDSIANRIGDKVSKKNTLFVSFDDTIILTDVLNNGQEKLF